MQAPWFGPVARLWWNKWRAMSLSGPRGALEQLSDHVGFTTFMNALISFLASRQNRATDAQYEHFIGMIGTQLREAAAGSVHRRGRTGTGTNAMICFRARYKVMGGHVHIRLFAASKRNAAFAKCGDFVVCVGDEWSALMKAMPGVMFMDEGLIEFEEAYAQDQQNA